MITDYKITEIFCAVDEFNKYFDSEHEKNSSRLLGSSVASARPRCPTARL